MSKIIRFPGHKSERAKEMRRNELYRKFRLALPPKQRNWSAHGHSFPSIKSVVMAAFAAVAIGAGAGSWMALSEKRAQAAPTNSAPTISTYFYICGRGGGENCVIDGDTFRYNGEKIRIVGIDTPETHPSRCPLEEELGPRAAVRLQELLNEGSFELRPLAGRDTDQYGRYLRYVIRNGNSIGDTLIAEGLARSYHGGAKESWCE